MNTLDRSNFDEYIHEMCSWPIERIVDEVADDEDLRGYLATCAGNYRNQLDWDEYNWKHRDESKVSPDICYFYETTRFLKDWNWMISEKFSEEADRKTIAEWAPSILRALDQRMQSQHSQNVKKRIEKENEEREKKAQKERLDEFTRRIPEEFATADVNDWTQESAKNLISTVLNGGSFLIWGGRGIGKTRLMYALTKKLLEDGKNAHCHITAAYISGLLLMATAKKMTVYDIIESYGVIHNSALFLDEADKLTNETQKEVLNYLIDRRYEHHLQTIMLCNAVDEQDLEAKLTSSIISRFKSKSWKARTLHLMGEDKRAKETTA